MDPMDEENGKFQKILDGYGRRNNESREFWKRRPRRQKELQNTIQRREAMATIEIRNI